MALRGYLIPIVRVALEGGLTYNCPKYFYHRYNPDTPLAGLENITPPWETYLLEEVGLAVADLDTTTHSLLAGQLDVLAIPANLNSSIVTSAVNTVRNYLETVKIPASWVVSGMTYRSALRLMLNIWQLHNRYVGRVGRKLFDGTFTLDSTVSDIPQQYRDDLQAAAESMGLDYSAVTPSTTIRQLLKGVADQLGNIEYSVGGLTI